MSNKKLVTLACVLAAAVLLIVLVNTLGNRRPSEESLQFFPDLTEKSIGAVLIKDASDEVKLMRKGDAWVMVPKKALESAAAVQASGLSKAMAADTAKSKPAAGMSAAEYPADSSTIATLLDNIAKCRKDILISENPEKQTTFEVDSARGISVEVFDLAGRSLGTIIIGKNSADWSGNYVRAKNSPAVYQAQSLSRYAFGTDHKRWTDKSIMKFDKATVKQIAIAKKGAPALVIERGDTSKTADSIHKGWHLTQPSLKATDSNKVDEILNSLSNFMAAEYEDSAYSDAATGVADPTIKVTLGFKSGTVRTLSIGNAKPGASKFWFKVPEKPFVFLMNDYDQKKFDKKPEDLVKQPPAPAKSEPAKTPAKKAKKEAAKK